MYTFYYKRFHIKSLCKCSYHFSKEFGIDKNKYGFNDSYLSRYEELRNLWIKEITDRRNKNV